MFDQKDILVVKSTGHRDDGTCAKTGKPVTKVGNVYLHNLVDCLTKYDGKFKYSDVVCLKSTHERLSKGAQMQLEKLKIRVEK